MSNALSNNGVKLELGNDSIKIYGEKNYKRTIILGTEDDVINPKMTKNIRPKYDNSAKFEEIEGMGHRTPLNVFINMYNKHV